MKHKRIFLALTVLVLASLACQALTGGGNDEPPAGDSNPPSVATQDSGLSDSSGGGESSASGFPLTADAYNVIDAGDGSVVFYTKMSLDDVMKFYRDEYISEGYVERGLLTVVSEGVFSIVFDGDPSGKAVVIQSVDLGDGSRTVTISLQDI